MRSYTVGSNDRVIGKQEDLSEVKLLRDPLVHFMFMYFWCLQLLLPDSNIYW